MINANAFGVGMAASLFAAHAAHAAVPAAAVKHRVAAATEVSVHRGST
ncbi:hypothetical protein MSIMFB_01359 [Mycobacterium simulans]|uniref:PE family protein n=1 Tax=Mycobacterium simulans TaxID=627089 RepID=A0A7Z7IK62_9MYCO|nr:hypothetical protein [Mycobacterium simulans]SOJ53862.1 hypothetical protein MSIMFB_01359 [Mycobacterium simulans]